MAVIVPAAFVAMIAVSLIGTSRSLQALGPTSGIPLPLEAGTSWEVVNGYNTVTHVDADPHALDFMRLDALAAGTAVLAPVPGRILHVDASCVGIFDEFTVIHFLCHVTAEPGLTRGDRVFAGQRVATIARPYEADNEGFPHLHYALHTRVENLRLVETIPFTGRYALEGEELPDSRAVHDHGGRVFTSTNVERRSAPGVGYLSPRWNLVGLPATAPPPFERYSRTTPAELLAPAALPMGDAIWVYVESATGANWERPRVLQERVVSLRVGMNAVTWTPAGRPVAEAVARLPGLVAVYGFDATSQRFVEHRPQAAASANTLSWLAPGRVVWVEMRTGAEWLQWAPGEVALASAAYREMLGAGEGR